jgi:hypothetical protein
MLWNSNFFMTLESMKILRVLTDVWLPDFFAWPVRYDASKDAMVLGDGDAQHCAACRMGRGFFYPPPRDAQSRLSAARIRYWIGLLSACQRHR